MAEKTYDEWLKEVKDTKASQALFQLLERIPMEHRTEELCLIAVKRNKEDAVNFMFHVPEKVKTYELCLAAVTRDSASFKFVPEELRTKEMSLAYIKQKKEAKYPSLMPGIPDALWKDGSFCLEAVQANYWALSTMPEDMRTAEVCLVVTDKMSKTMSNDSLLQDIPEKLWQDADFCNEAASNHGTALQYVPDKLKTAELCVKAIYSASKAFGGKGNDKYILDHYVPSALKDKVAVKVGFGKEGEDIAAAKEAAALANGAGKGEKAIAALSKAIELCPFTTNTKKNGEEVAIISIILLERAAAYKALGQVDNAAKDCYDALEFEGFPRSKTIESRIEEILDTEEACLAAVQKYGMSLNNIPEKQRTEAVCLAAVQRQKWALQWVPDAMKTEAVCIAAVQKFGKDAMDYVPKELQAKVKKALKK